MTEVIHADLSKWRRLSPLSFLHFIVKGLIGLVKQGLQAILPAAAVFVSFGENRWLAIGLIIAGIIAIIIIGSILSYLKFRYRLSGDTVYIQSGVLKRKRISLSFDRIQNISLKEPIYFRPFSHVVLAIESAGSASEEVSLGGIPRELADEIRQYVLGNKKTTQAATTLEATEATQETETPEEEIITQPISELVRYGLTSNNIWVIAGLSTGALAQIDWEDYAFDDKIQESVMSFIGTSGLSIALYSIMSTLFILALLLGLSVLGTIISNYNFRMTRSKGRFHRTKGLLERQETSLLERKIQSLVVKQNWIAKLLKRYTIDIRQIGFGDKNKDPQAALKAGKKFFIPSVEGEFAVQFTKLIYPPFNWTEKPLKSIDAGFIRRIVFFVVFPITVIPAISFTIASESVFGMFPLLAPVIAWPIVTQVHKRYGYAKDEQHAVVRTGFIGKKYTLFPLHKVQSVEIHRSPGQRLKGLATLHIKLAGSSVTIPYIPHLEAMEWRRDILKEMKSSHISWM